MTGIELVSVAGRIVGYAAMAVLVGGLLFVSLLWPAGARERRTRLMLGISVVAGIAAAGVSVGVVIWQTDGALSLADALAAEQGRVATANALLWVLAAVVVAAVLQRGNEIVRTLPWCVGATVVAGGLLRTAGMASHASQGSHPAWGGVADFLHLLAVSAWVGGLAVMTVALLPRRRLQELESVVPGFSRVAQSSVLLLLASGAILLWQVVGSVDDFWSTDYARVLVVKASLLGLVLLAAMASKRWVDKHLADAIATHRETAVRSLAASVATETVLVLTVLGAASVLVTSSPGI